MYVMCIDLVCERVCVCVCAKRACICVISLGIEYDARFSNNYSRSYIICAESVYRFAPAINILPVFVSIRMSIHSTESIRFNEHDNMCMCISLC